MVSTAFLLAEEPATRLAIRRPALVVPPALAALAALALAALAALAARSRMARGVARAPPPCT
eukprot:scaffold28433_cov44-Phaeocystis_antarctica.AAC.1